MRSIEILAPAGNMDCLKAALSAGADAIYCAGLNFGARAYAANFNKEELKQAVDLAHQYNKKIYITMNTLLYEDEVDNALQDVDYYYHIGVDALLIQDLGLFDLIHQYYPDFDLHCSTQMNIHDVNGVNFAKSIGAKRVVLARECDKEMIGQCCQQGIEIEVFSYGALCSSYSGQCLISSISTNRSGNRGQCSQNCRLPYDFYIDNKLVNNDDKKYLLSLKDLNLIQHLNELIDMGVSSLKIEGRMKSSQYVYYIVSLFNKAKQAYFNNQEFKLSNQEINNCKLLFNRGFTLGYAYHATNSDIRAIKRPNHQGIEVGKVVKVNKNSFNVKLSYPLYQHDGCRILSDNDQGLYIHTMKYNNEYITVANVGQTIEIINDIHVNVGDILLKTNDNLLLKQIDYDIENNKQHVALNIKVEINNCNISVYIIDNYQRSITYSSDIKADIAINKAIDTTTLTKQFNKLKETVFYLNNLEYISDNNYFLPVSLINEIRRNAVDSFIKQIITINRSNKQDITLNCNFSDYPVYKSLVWLDDKQKDNLVNGNDYVISTKDDNYDKLGPLIHVSNENKEYKFIQYIGDINNNWQVGLSSLCCTNSYAIAFYLNHKVIPTFSIEADNEKIEKSINKFKERYNIKPVLYQITYSTPRLMSMKECFIKSFYNTGDHCNKCHNDNIEIIDKYKNKYKVEGDNNCILHLYSTNVIKNKLVNGCFSLKELI